MPATIKLFQVPTGEDEFEMELPQGGGILSFQMWNGSPSLWVLADSEAPMMKSSFRICRTGELLKPSPGGEGLGYVGSVYKHLHPGADGVVLHLFKLVRAQRIVPPGAMPPPGGLVRPGRN